MKRALALACAAAAAVLTSAPAAHAHHVCLATGDNPYVCLPHVDDIVVECPEWLCD